MLYYATVAFSCDVIIFPLHIILNGHRRHLYVRVRIHDRWGGYLQTVSSHVPRDLIVYGICPRDRASAASGQCPPFKSSTHPDVNRFVSDVNLKIIIIIIIWNFLKKKPFLFSSEIPDGEKVSLYSCARSRNSLGRNKHAQWPAVNDIPMRVTAVTFSRGLLFLWGRLPRFRQYIIFISLYGARVFFFVVMSPEVSSGAFLTSYRCQNIYLYNIIYFITNGIIVPSYTRQN